MLIIFFLLKSINTKFRFFRPRHEMTVMFCRNYSELHIYLQLISLAILDRIILFMKKMCVYVVSGVVVLNYGL